jgi:hypothetical protein
MKARLLVLVVIGGLLGSALGVKVARSQSSASVYERVLPRSSDRGAPANSPLLVVPRASSTITIDGEPDDVAWTSRELLRTPVFSERPYTDARLTVRDGTLYVLAYAADEDLHAASVGADLPLSGADAMRVVLTPRTDGREYVIEVSPRGALTDYTRARSGSMDATWSSGAKVGIDLDGTLDDVADSDEEWVAELSIPLSSLGPLQEDHTVGVRIERIDVSGPGTVPMLMSWSPPRGRVLLAQ